MKTCVMDFVSKLLFPSKTQLSGPSQGELDQARAAWRDEVHLGKNLKTATIMIGRDKLKASDKLIDAAHDAVAAYESLRDKDKDKAQEQ